MHSSSVVIKNNMKLQTLALAVSALSRIISH